MHRRTPAGQAARFGWSMARVGFASAFLGAATLLMAVVSATAVQAHERGTSYSTWEIRGRVARVVLRLTELDVSRLPWAATAGNQRSARLGNYLAGRLVLLAGDAPCALTHGPQALASEPGVVHYEWQLHCPGEAPLSIQSLLLREVSPSHLHFARARIDGGPFVERILSGRGDLWELGKGVVGTESPQGVRLGDYVVLGIEHILGGFDHLAFVLALLLLGGSLMELTKMVSGFTVAHSITLAAMVLGYLRPDPAPIEALIGISIALVAIENLWQVAGRGRAVPLVVTLVLGLLAAVAMLGYGRVPALTLFGLGLFVACYFGLLGTMTDAGSLRWAIAFLFGLVHGFGFAAVLDEAGLPSDRVAVALFGFNAGVEIGQLAVVVTVWPLLRVLRRRWEVLEAWVVEAGSAAVLAVGLFWFVTRTYG